MTMQYTGRAIWVNPDWLMKFIEEGFFMSVEGAVTSNNWIIVRFMDEGRIRELEGRGLYEDEAWKEISHVI